MLEGAYGTMDLTFTSGHKMEECVVHSTTIYPLNQLIFFAQKIKIVAGKVNVVYIFFSRFGVVPIEIYSNIRFTIAEVGCENSYPQIFKSTVLEIVIRSLFFIFCVCLLDCMSFCKVLTTPGQPLQLCSISLYYYLFSLFLLP